MSRFVRKIHRSIAILSKYEIYFVFQWLSSWSLFEKHWSLLSEKYNLLNPNIRYHSSLYFQVQEYRSKMKFWPLSLSRIDWTTCQYMWRKLIVWSNTLGNRMTLWSWLILNTLSFVWSHSCWEGWVGPSWLVWFLFQDQIHQLLLRVLELVKNWRNYNLLPF